MFADSAQLAADPQLQFRLPNREGKILLGAVQSPMEAVTLPGGRMEHHALEGQPVGIADDRHIITVAGSRSGKGRSVLIPNLITYPGSVLVIDPKGELAQETARWRHEKLGQEVFVLDPFKAAHTLACRFQAGFNALAEIDAHGGSLMENAALIADALIVPTPGNADPHWDESARLFLEAVIMHVATFEKYQQRRDLVSVYECLMEMGSEDLAAEMNLNEAANGEVLLLANIFYEKAEKERSSILSTLRRHIRFLGYQAMAGVLSTHSFSLKRLKTDCITVYLSLPAMRMGTCSRWLRLFVNLTLAALEEEKQKPEYPVLMCLDEFATLGYMKALEDAAGQIAGLGCKLWPVLQDLSQLKGLYASRWETFMGNAGVLQFFGNSDMTTLDWISKRLGETTIINRGGQTTSYAVRGTQGLTGESLSQQAHKLMTPEEVSRFFSRDDQLARQLIIRVGAPAIVLHRTPYDRHALFTDYRKFMTATRP